MLVWFFTAVYFLFSGFLLSLIFRNFLSVETDLISIFCLIIAFFASVGLAEYTVKKIKEKYSKK